MATRRRFLGQLRPLHSPADPEEWGDALPEYMRQTNGASAQQSRDNLGNEVSWGRKQSFVLDIPAGSTDTVLQPSKDLDQLINVRVPARSWTMGFSFQWTNQAQGDPADTLQAVFAYEFGVGSCSVPFLRVLDIPQNAPININSLIIDPFPASTIVVSVRLSCTPVAGAARKYAGTIGAIVAPVTR